MVLIKYTLFQNSFFNFRLDLASFFECFDRTLLFSHGNSTDIGIMFHHLRPLEIQGLGCENLGDTLWLFVTIRSFAITLRIHIRKTSDTKPWNYVFCLCRLGFSDCVDSSACLGLSKRGVWRFCYLRKSLTITRAARELCSVLHCDVFVGNPEIDFHCMAHLL